MFYHVNFTAEISIEAWQTADDIRDNTDEMQDTVEPALEDAISITAAGEDLDNTDVAISSAMVEISDNKMERKPEEELFLLVDDDLDNDIISSHAAAFHRVDPQLQSTPDAATSQPLTPSKASPAEGDGAKKKTSDNADVDVTHNTSNEDSAAAKTKISEKASPKRLVFGADWVLHQHSRDCEYVRRYYFR